MNDSTTLGEGAPRGGELRALTAYLGPERGPITGTVVLVTLSLLSLSALAALPAWALGRAVTQGTAPAQWFWWVLVGLIVLRAALTWAEMDVSHSVAFRILARLRMTLFDAYAIALPTRRRDNVGHAAATAMADTERLEFFYAHTVAQLIGALINLAAGVVILVVVHPPLAAVALFATALLALSTQVQSRRTAALGREVAEGTSALSAHVVDVLGGLREVLGYHLQHRVRRQIAEAGSAVAERSDQLETTTRLVAASREALLILVSAAVLAVAAWARVDPALMPAVVVLTLLTIAPAADAAATVAQLHPLRASAGRVRDEVQRPATTTQVPPPGASIPQGPLGLAFRGVRFGYDHRTVLENFSLEIAAGEHVALTGPSGVGKSTVVALAGRLWDPDDGCVMMRSPSKDVDIAEVLDADLRHTIAVVEQDARLFVGTVADNLLLHGRSTRADLVAGLKTFGLAEVIGPDDELGESGVRLSGGQQARLRLLRAILLRPRILVVDEPTADLDPDSAAIVHEVLFSLPCTLLVVSHQEHTLTAADRIVCLPSRQR